MTAIWKVWFTAIIPNHLNPCWTSCSRCPKLLSALQRRISCAVLFAVWKRTGRTFTCGIWGIPFPTGIWLYKTINIWSKLKKLELRLNQRVVSVNSSWSSSHESLGETEGEFAFAVISLLIQAKQMKQPGLLYSPWQCKKQKTATANREGIFAFELPSPL